MELRRSVRRGLPLLLLGGVAVVILRRQLYPRPALPPGEPLAPPEVAPAPERSEGRFAERLRRVPIDIVTVVDDLLGAAR